MPVILNVRVNPGRHSAALILDKAGTAEGGGTYVGSITMTARGVYTAQVSQAHLKGVAGVSGSSVDDVMATLKARAASGTIAYRRR